MSAEELLSRTAKQIPPSYAGVYSGDAHRVEEIVTRLEDVADALRAMSYDLGLEGEAADAGAAAFEQVRLKLLDRAAQATRAASAARRAYEDLMEARDYQLSPLASVVNRQSVSMWTDIPDCAVFGNEYADRRAKVQHGLIEVRDDVRTLFDALKLSAADLARTDDEIRERLDALADRLSDIPVIAEVGMPLAPRPAAGSDGSESGEEWE